MELWKTIPEFPKYSVSNYGLIRRDAPVEHNLIFSENRYGVVTVGLMRGDRQWRRSVSLIVAKAFLLKTSPAFDTPICLDGDRWNNHVNNLAWRPRWFAVQYNRQMRIPYENRISRTLRDIKTGETFPDSFECAKWFGLLEKDVVLSISNRTYTWPTYQQFEVVL